MNRKNSHLDLSRRNLLKLSAGFIGTGALTARLGSNFVFAAEPAAEPAAAEDNITPAQALEMLMDGNQRFATSKRLYPDQSFIRLKQVAQAQKPFAAILSCSDSRVPTEIVFDQGLGDIFVVRVAGNIAITEAVGSLEYANLLLGSKVLMVLGHERCGAVKATLEAEEVPGMIGSLFYPIRPAVDDARKQQGNLLENAVKTNVMFQVERLKTSSVITNLIKEDKLKVVGAYYDLDDGKVTLLS